jgi:hypothetical protein
MNDFQLQSVLYVGSRRLPLGGITPLSQGCIALGGNAGDAYEAWGKANIHPYLMVAPAEEAIKSEVKLPVIRIHSDRKGPEAVVFDTTGPTFMLPMEKDRAATPRAVASTESSATETVSQPSGSMPEGAEPAKLNQPKAQHREISVGAHARLTRRPLHPAFSASSNPMFAAAGRRMREAFAQDLPFPHVPTPNHINHAIQGEKE